MLRKMQVIRILFSSTKRPEETAILPQFELRASRSHLQTSQKQLKIAIFRETIFPEHRFRKWLQHLECDAITNFSC